MTDIRSTLTEAVDVPAGYRHLLDQAVTVLESRERAATEILVGFAQDQGLDHETAVNAIQRAGLSVYTPPPVEHSPVSGSSTNPAAKQAVLDAIGALAEAVAAL